MWKNLVGSIGLNELTNSEPKDVGGCIVSHAPGIGKIWLTILFLHVYLELSPNSRPKFIVSESLLLTRGEEFKKWNKKWNTGIPCPNLLNPEFSEANISESCENGKANRHL
ncbi:hypothetical protein ACJRO7_017689 [Eucalyptus globulus]|uniref:Uncharacterized protein n=1 Tax=Eucalyptus globulus TaxID=34317 RepID=A0ABD3L273_EUCGL